MSGILSIVATPIGNLTDITERALDTLRFVDIILCEDTRVTRNLLSRYKITTDVMSFHQHSDDTKIQEVLSLLVDGKHLALVTDAGTPTISDPGGILVDIVRRELPDVEITSAPGVSAVITALSVSGMPADKFVFLGFPPLKNKRKKYFEEVASQKYTVVFYESCHRIKKTVANLVEVLDSETQVCVCRELTKKFESVYCGSISEVTAMDIPEKGEFVVVVRR
ncbi:MAG: 16S rRNA (cytidine(1402)-2'-O)-methyltransferase [Candidatus Magasanikbacteria bacterium CG11_big_fil_rev_8_21_14_0_20_43_7]|uniref:Ribosomal RNA small subunit methyltransferase I n=1 Tax=Candidatus Magasanikbacteria bacterium CG11_big_fil_rev_8_21_14_0_20_43_7 TaxID=1974654 RepID=A0A2H0N2L8_9BACT|nr:MAG: 16S rRNA (cytidine(1402)-2'-O)-methyltransferase [Candidatus Magasanikbacteria bacterium CG11_big_fil_rev_8_21_14_0_20_43_7]